VTEGGPQRRPSLLRFVQTPIVNLFVNEVGDVDIAVRGPSVVCVGYGVCGAVSAAASPQYQIPGSAIAAQPAFARSRRLRFAFTAGHSLSRTL
jgi:hypothetical protein